MIQVAILSRASARVAKWCRWMYSTLISELNDSAAALSRADPTRLIDAGKEQVEATLGNPTVRYSLMGLAALIVLAVLRKLFR